MFRRTIAGAIVQTCLLTLVPGVWSVGYAAPQKPACGTEAKAVNLNFKLKDVAGNDIDLNAYRGKVLLINLWATWCGPCKIEIPGFVALYSRYKARGFEVLGLLVNDQVRNAKAFAEKHKMNYPVIDADEHDDVRDAFGPLWALPTSFIVSRDGRLCKQHVGWAPTDQFELEIKALLEAPTGALRH